MIEGPQNVAKLVGAEGCYAIAGIVIAETATGRRFPILESIAHGIRLGFIDAECIVDMPRFFSDLTKEEWDVVKAGPGHPLPLDYKLQPGEYEALRFERPDPAGGDPLPHFVVGKGDGQTVAFDPWTNSLTVRYGTLVSRRIFRRKAKVW
jgi:hypothetical protein